MEILKWIMEHGPIDGFAIIDDSEDMCHLKNRLVRTTWMCGFQERHVEQVLEQLKQPMLFGPQSAPLERSSSLPTTKAT